MRMVNMHDAKTHFSKLVEAVIHGEEILIAKAGKPLAKLSPLPSKTKRSFGVLEGKISISDDFDGPLSEKILSDFEG